MLSSQPQEIFHVKEMVLVMKEWGQRRGELWVGSDEVENLESLSFLDWQNQSDICGQEPSRV